MQLEILFIMMKPVNIPQKPFLSEWCFKFLFFSLFSFLLIACSDNDEGKQPADIQQKSIVVLYENDVHCGIEGYAKIAGLRDAIAASDTAFAAVVSSGDFLSGGLPGANSQGKAIVSIMRNVGYDAITLGNHEFDYGTPWMEELLKNINTTVVCANFFHSGATEPVYAPYIIRQYGKKRVAFVGVCTPETMQSEAYSFYDKDGKLLYDLRTEQVYSLVQQAVDNARAEGADFVVVLSHLGEAVNETGITSHGLVAATTGIDVVLDGHTHSAIVHDYVKNKEGKDIIVTQSGTNFMNVGKLVISKEGIISTELIPIKNIEYVNTIVAASTDSVNNLLNEVKSRILATSDYDLQINDENGKRIVRSAETNLGDLITDAFRITLEADIGLQNGGGIRSSIKAGNISYGDVFNALPFSNTVSKIEATGEKIIKMLQACIAKAPEEDGNFPQVSGITFTVHTISHTISDVKVFDADTGDFIPIDPQKNYTIGVGEYFNTGGYYDTLKDCKVLMDNGQLDRDLVASYLELVLKRTTGSAYAHSQGRIKMVAD